MRSPPDIAAELDRYEARVIEWNDVDIGRAAALMRDAAATIRALRADLAVTRECRDHYKAELEQREFDLARGAGLPAPKGAHP